MLVLFENAAGEEMGSRPGASSSGLQNKNQLQRKSENIFLTFLLLVLGYRLMWGWQWWFGTQGWLVEQLMGCDQQVPKSRVLCLGP